MTAQLQFLNKILCTQDYSLISQNNLTEELFFNYRAEFNFIKNHYKKYNNKRGYQCRCVEKICLSEMPEFSEINIKKSEKASLLRCIRFYTLARLVI